MTGWLTVAIAKAGAAPVRWAMAGALLALVMGVPLALALTWPAVDPVITVVNTGSGGLIVVPDTAGRLIVVGGSLTHTGAAVALDRHLPFWQRSIGLLVAAPPHATSVPGLLDILDRRAVGRASLLGTAPVASPALDAWHARRTAPPLVGATEVALASGARLVLDTGDYPDGDAALAIIARGPIQVVVLLGDAAPLIARRMAAGASPVPTAVVQIGRGQALPATNRPTLQVVLDGGGAGGSAGTTVLPAGEAVRITVLADRLRLSGDPVAAQHGRPAAYSK